jgi:hypothetical protein
MVWTGARRAVRRACRYNSVTWCAAPAVTRQPHARALSSAGRASPLQGEGRGFEPLSAHRSTCASVRAQLSRTQVAARFAASLERRHVTLPGWGADDRVADLAGLLNRRLATRLLALQRIQDLDRCVAAPMDQVTGSWLDTVVRWRDAGPLVDNWPRQVNQVEHDAVAIGDAELRRRVSMVVAWREPLAEVLAWRPGLFVSPPPTKLPRPSVKILDALMASAERLEELIRRARR